MGNGILPQPSRSLYSQYLRTEAPLFWRKRTCCIETFGHVRPKVSYIFGGIKFGSRKLLVCIVVFNSTSFLALLGLWHYVLWTRKWRKQHLTWIFIDLMQVVNVHILVEYATPLENGILLFIGYPKEYWWCGIHPVIGSWPYWVWDSSSKIVQESFLLQ